MATVTEKDKRPMTREEMEAMGDAALPIDLFVATAEFDPDQESWHQAPEGRHLMQIAEATLGPMIRNGDQWQLTPVELSWKGEKCYGLQLNVTWETVGGEHAGSRIRDTLPFPTTGQPFLPDLASRLGNAVRRWGLAWPRLPDGRELIVPPELARPALINKTLVGKRAYVEVVMQTKENRQGPLDAKNKYPRVPNLRNDGTPWHQVKLFGYEFADPAAKQAYMAELAGKGKGENGGSGAAREQSPLGAAVGASIAAGVGTATGQPVFDL